MRSKTITPTPQDIARKQQELRRARRRLHQVKDDFRELARFVGLSEKRTEDIVQEIKDECGHAQKR